jgi:hypothetical protein
MKSVLWPEKFIMKFNNLTDPLNIEGLCRYAAYLLELGKEYKGLPEVIQSSSFLLQIRDIWGGEES